MGRLITVKNPRVLLQLVVDHVLDAVDGDSLSLANVTIWVPSARVGEKLRHLFLVAQGGSAVLPSVQTLSIEEEEGGWLQNSLNGDMFSRPVLSVWSRKALFAKFIRERDNTVSFSQSMQVADTLTSVFKKCVQYQITPEKLLEALPQKEGLAKHWQLNQEFLQVVMTVYPQYLEAIGFDDPDVRRKDLLLAQASYYTEKGAQYPVYAVGFNDTTPVGVSVLKSILSLEMGTVILNGLDVSVADDVTFPASHPQYAVRELVCRLGYDMKDVEVWSSEYSLESFWTSSFSDIPVKQGEENLSHVSLLEVDSVEKEALCAALIMRETLEHEGETCALITTDRSFARRVQSALSRWGVLVDDSAGQPLHLFTEAKIFLDALKVVVHQFSPVALADFLSHQKVCLLEDDARWREKVFAFHTHILGGLTPPSGLEGLRMTLDLRVSECKDSSWKKDVEDILDSLKCVFEPFLLAEDKRSLLEWVQAHERVMDKVFATYDEPLWRQGDVGEALFGLFQELLEACDDLGKLTSAEYLTLLNTAIPTVVVRSSGHNTHPRLKIWGTLEARLQSVDRVIISGLNEGSWPKGRSDDFWLSPAMAELVGLPDPDMSVGLLATDFIALSNTRKVYWSRAQSSGGQQLIPSRFLLRTLSILEDEARNALFQRGSYWTQCADMLMCKGNDAVREAVYGEAPLTVRPSVWSASQVKSLMQCPYQHYVRKILKLESLDEMEKDPSAADRGNLIHKCLEAFFSPVEGCPAPYSGNMENEENVTAHFMNIANVIFLKILDEGLRAMWLQRFFNVAQGMAKSFAQMAREGREVIAVERKGSLALTNQVSLFAQADRLDSSPDGVIVVDYKTGNVPSRKNVRLGLEPQMAVESVLVAAGAYGVQSQLTFPEYWKVSFGKGDGVKIQNAIGAKADLDSFVTGAEEGLKRLAEHFSDENAHYDALPGGATGLDLKGACEYCDYAGVCRFREWHGVEDVS